MKHTHRQSEIRRSQTEPFETLTKICSVTPTFHFLAHDLTTKLGFSAACYAGDFVPGLSNKTKAKHLSDLFPSELLAEPAQFSAAGELIEMDTDTLALKNSEHYVVLAYDPTTSFLEFVAMSALFETETNRPTTLSIYPKGSVLPRVSFVGTDLVYKHDMEIPPGKYKVKLEAPGYEARVFDIDVKPNRSNFESLDFGEGPWSVSLDKSKLL